MEHEGYSFKDVMQARRGGRAEKKMEESGGGRGGRWVVIEMEMKQHESPWVG
jgi:hypothetical protein